MKISFDWLQEYLPLDISLEETTEILTSIGLEVGKTERRESIRGGLNGVVCGLVKECHKHPNADRLHLCKVSVGNAEDLQIVCGAPNVAEGQKVWVAQVGTTLYPTGNEDPLIINKVKVRGEHSEGMICAEDELGLGEDHDGIMVLPDSLEPGTGAREYYEVTSDDIIEIDLTPNRSDATSHLGVAGDLAAYLKVNRDGEYSVRYPDVEVEFPEATGNGFHVAVENTEACPRYAGVIIEGIQVAESPAWLKRRLLSIDVRPINNVVDVTNFVLHEMGQPLHAFDADKIAGNGIIVRTLPEGTPFVTLDEVERKLSDTDLMICDGEGKGMCIGGIFGGVGTGVTEKTTRIFLESAHFNPVWIRRSSMRHLLRTDAAKTFEKTTDPNICVKALKRAAQLIAETSGGQVASALTDIYPEPIRPVEVTVRWDRLNLLTGVHFKRPVVHEILKALHMEILWEDDAGVAVAVPTNKADVTREADVIEEILRIYGFDRIPLQNKIDIALQAVPRPTLPQMRNLLSAMLSALGFYEMMGLSLTEEKYFEDGPMALDPKKWVIIENTSNVGLNLMRPDLLISALETARHNQSRNQGDLRLYEFGHAYQLENGEITERQMLTLLLTGSEVPENWLSISRQESPYFAMKKYVEAILGRLGVSDWRQEETSDPRFVMGTGYFAGREQLVTFGQLAAAVTEAFDLRGDVYFARFAVRTLYDLFRKNAITVDEVSKFPAVKRDLAFDLPAQVAYASLTSAIRSTGPATLQSVRLFDIYKDEKHLGKSRKSYAVQLLFEDKEKTLTDSEVDSAVKVIVAAVAKELGGKLRG